MGSQCVNNCQKTKRSGPLKIDKKKNQKKIGIKREQQTVKAVEKFMIGMEKLHL